MNIKRRHIEQNSKKNKENRQIKIERETVRTMRTEHTFAWVSANVRQRSEKRNRMVNSKAYQNGATSKYYTLSKVFHRVSVLAIGVVRVGECDDAVGSP